MKAVNLEKSLPSDIPAGEHVLWHGRPDWISLTRRAYRADLVAAYFVAMTAWNSASIGHDSGFAAGALAAARTMAAGIAAIALLALLAWLSSRTTLYVVTSRRLIMKVGIALPIFFNVPYSQIASASMRLFSDGTGDIPVALNDGQRIAYLHLWPHARPFRFARVEPALRSVRNAASIAELLGGALRAASETARADGPVARDAEPETIRATPRAAAA